METKDIILELRTKNGMSQEELAEKVFVTRQAVSRWESGETIPNTETLKLLSKLFDISINTLLGSPRQLVCECCGMPIDDSNVSHEKDGAFNEDYCKWCYADGKYTLDFLEKYRKIGGKEKFEEFKQQLIHEFNTLLHIEGLPKVEKLNVLSGSFINLEYHLPNGQSVKFFDDNATYLGSQLECEFGGNRCFGIAANMEFLLVCTYEENGKNPELVFYKKRQTNWNLFVQTQRNGDFENQSRCVTEYLISNRMESYSFSSAGATLAYPSQANRASLLSSASILSMLQRYR